MILQLFGLQGEHPEVFSSLPTTLGQLRSALSEKPTGALNASHEADLLFLGELHIITGILDAVSALPLYCLLDCNLISFIWFRERTVVLKCHDSRQVV